MRQKAKYKRVCNTYSVPVFLTTEIMTDNFTRYKELITLNGRLPDDQRQAILQRIDRAVSHYWQHPFRRAQDGDHHPIDPKTADYTDGYHE